MHTSSLLVSKKVSPAQGDNFHGVDVALRLYVYVFFLVDAFVVFERVSFVGRGGLKFRGRNLVRVRVAFGSQRKVGHRVSSLTILGKFARTKVFAVARRPCARGRIR